ncbi:hypothetical protein C0Q70_00476 [Pomacea canaliculata]|uniref:Peptidase M12B domain-containing protein n=2 Tax=Pomacea canaliculata TaxID=400727 RepID=A0A2T7PWS4_POMCA|nr:hypothetical protein C0Q70_00476 [Pomacea canaliculata]
MNNLYETMKTYGISLDVRLKQIYFLTTDLWGKQALRPGYRDQIISNKALDMFYAWSVKARENSLIKPFDHAMLITGYNILDPKDPNKLTSGVAYKGVICKYGSVSVIENIFTYQMIDTTAHELGHSLGADHDGENNNCNMADGYVMTSRTEINSTNRWSFSPCSVNAIKSNIAQLDSLGANCLTDTVISPTPPQELGELFSPDQQCRLLKGPEGFLCRDFYDSTDSYSKLCTSMWCSRSPTDAVCQNHIASDGFVCGNRKTCQRGECLPNPQAPEVSDSCPQGDEPGKVYRDLSCSDLARREPWLCYNYLVRRKCCVSCPSVKDDAEGCEYGDKEAWCSTTMKYPYDCYYNAKTCCKSCRQYRRSDTPGCEYGDQSADCSTKLTLPVGCYQNEKLCCESCAKAKSTTNPDCPYGDKSNWCKEKLLVPRGCYRNKALCCDTCAPYANQTEPTTTRRPTPPPVPTSSARSASGSVDGPSSSSTSGPTSSFANEPSSGSSNGSTSGSVNEPASGSIDGSASSSTNGSTSGSANEPASGSTSGSTSGSVNEPASGSTSGPDSGSTSGSASGSTSGPDSGSTSGSPSGSTSGPASGSTSGSASGSTSGSASGSPSGSAPTASADTGYKPSRGIVSSEPSEPSDPDCISGDRDPAWCQERVPYGCYNSTVAARCCKSCKPSPDAVTKGCEYGDHSKACEKLIFPYACYKGSNADICCYTCGLFLDASRTNCLYGDKKNWCHKLRMRFTNDKWCPNDKENGHCCGTCLYNQTAVPATGLKIRDQGVPTPLG